MQGKTVLITGASRGIGKAIAQLFAKSGAKVITPSRKEMDLSSSASIVAYCAKLKIPVDILINNAGINVLGDLCSLDMDNVENTLQINLKAPLLLAQKIVPGMVQRGGGWIVNISSVWGDVSKPKRIIYSTAKSGLNAMTRSMAVELAQHNILVNAVAPGFVDTELTRQNNSPTQIEQLKEGVPLKRLANPAEIAQVVFFLASPKNSYITGQVITVDGGFTCL